MGLLELLNKYNAKVRLDLHLRLYTNGWSAIVHRDGTLRKAVGNPEKLRDWLVEQTADKSDDTKVYL